MGCIMRKDYDVCQQKCERLYSGLIGFVIWLNQSENAEIRKQVPADLLDELLETLAECDSEPPEIKQDADHE